MHDYKDKIFLILISLISEGAWTSIGCFRQKGRVPETSYRMLEVHAFIFRSGEGLSVITFPVKEVKWRFPGCLFSKIMGKNFKLNPVLSVSLLKSKDL